MGLDLVQHREAIVDALQPLMPARVKVQTHPGRFDLQDLHRYALQAPCICIAVLDFTDFDSTYPQGPVSLAAYIVTKDGKGMERSEQNLLLGSLLVAVCKTSALVSADAKSPYGVAYKNLYSVPVAADGACLGSVSWTQELKLVLPDNAAPGAVPFETLHANYDFAPADEAIDNQQDITIQQGSP